MVGLPDRPPAGWSFSYLDHVGGYLGAVAILAGVIHRRRTGEGQHIDVSQLEPATALSGALLLDAMLNGRPSRRPGFPTGNRRAHPPERARRARTGPRVTTSGWWSRAAPRTQWEALVEAMGRPSWALDPRFATLAGRVEHADDLDAHVEAWTVERDRYEVMDLLQRAGRPRRCRAGRRRPPRARPAARGPRALHHARQRRGGPAPPRGRPLPHVGHAAAHRGVLHRGPPCLGEDNDTVLGEVLGMSADDVAALAADGALS